MARQFFKAFLLFALISPFVSEAATDQTSPRQRISIDDDWRFLKEDPSSNTVRLLYDVRPQPGGRRGGGGTNASSSAPTNEPGAAPLILLKPWILPTGNAFLTDASQKFLRPATNPADNIACSLPDFDDSSWQRINLPHDWAITGPFTTSGGGGMGRLPSAGVAWYRKKLALPAADAGKSIFLDVDGAMSYAAVWLNGHLLGGWPYGYASWRIDLTPFIKPGADNELALRLDNPPDSSRWYPGGGIYRNVWLVKTSPLHVGQWGTYVTTPQVSANSATVDLKITVDNNSPQDATVRVVTQIFPLDADGRRAKSPVATFAPVDLSIPASSNALADTAALVPHPRLWGPPPNQHPNLYLALTTVSQGEKTLDTYETTFGIRTIKFDPNAGFFINGEHVPLNGVCDHHDLGSLGTAVNTRALQRQLQMLQDMGCNALRTSHNPPAPEFLELAQRMGFLVMDEMFDVWNRQKTPFDFHLTFPDWHEQDLRAQIRRDRNSPSVILWSIGNEVGEQFTGTNGAALAHTLSDLVHSEDPTRPTTTAMNTSGPTNPFSAATDAIGLNYQGAGIRTAPGQYPAFHAKFPNTFIYSSESASAFSTRGDYLFPVATNNGTPVGGNAGEDRAKHQVSAYELYYASFGASVDKVFASQDKNPYVGGEFVWTGWDYLGEPTPFDSSRSSYSGIIDLAGFKKDRFYLYQAHWRPEFPMAHILPHWTWPDRVGQITPVHVFTSGDEGELFLNGKSLGRKKKGQYEYRLRWDDVAYQPGTLKVVTYKNGRHWAEDTVKTAGPAAKITLTPDRDEILSDGRDLSFITATITDKNGNMAPRADNRIHFQIDGPGEIVSTDNGDPTSLESFQSSDRNAFNGLCLVIVRAKSNQPGKFRLTATAESLKPATTTVKLAVFRKP